MADAADLKSDVERRVGSNPTGGTIHILGVTMDDPDDFTFLDKALAILSWILVFALIFKVFG